MANKWKEIIQAIIDLQNDPELDTEPGPSFQFYPQQWLADVKVMLMSMAARGIHLHLILLAWKGLDLEDQPIPCSIPDDPELLRAICHRPDGWDELWIEVSKSWRRYKGRLWNLGLCRAYLAQMQNRKRRKKAGKVAAQARWGKAKRNAAKSKGDGIQPKSSVTEPESQSHTRQSHEDCESDSSDEEGEYDSQNLDRSLQDQPPVIHPDNQEQTPSDCVEPTHSCDSKTDRMTEECDSHPKRSESHSPGSSNRAIGTVATVPSSSPTSSTSTSSSEIEGVQRGKGRTSPQKCLPKEIEALAIPRNERQEIARLIANPAAIDPEAHRARKITDEKAAKIERPHRLARLAVLTRSVVEKRSQAGDFEDTALELWAAWRARRKAKAKSERRPWHSELVALRQLTDPEHSPEDVIEALIQAGTAGWQGFEWSWLKKRSSIDQSRTAGAAGFLPAQEDGINV